jgi:CRISP-associated protein Cas1
MRIKLDENLPAELADDLRRLGHLVDTVADEGLEGQHPVNSLLSLAYSLLAKDLTIICHSIGLDPFIGFYHQPRFGRPALALDLMEEFRPLIGDSVVIGAINTGMVTVEDFMRVGPAVALTQKGRRNFIRAYEQRMDGLVTHPMSGTG